MVSSTKDFLLYSATLFFFLSTPVPQSREEKQMLIKQVQDAEEVARRVSAKAEIG